MTSHLHRRNPPARDPRLLCGQAWFWHEIIGGGRTDAQILLRAHQAGPLSLEVQAQAQARLALACVPELVPPPQPRARAAPHLLHLAGAVSGRRAPPVDPGAEIAGKFGEAVSPLQFGSSGTRLERDRPLVSLYALWAQSTPDAPRAADVGCSRLLFAPRTLPCLFRQVLWAEA